MNGQQFQAPIPSTKSIEDAKLISGALDTLNKVSIKCKKANDAIMSGNKIRMWNVLQELINEYGDAINQNHRNTGKQVVFANINSHTIDQIKNQLQPYKIRQNPLKTNEIYAIMYYAELYS